MRFSDWDARKGQRRLSRDRLVPRPINAPRLKASKWTISTRDDTAAYLLWPRLNRHYLHLLDESFVEICGFVCLCVVLVCDGRFCCRGFFWWVMDWVDVCYGNYSCVCFSMSVYVIFLNENIILYSFEKPQSQIIKKIILCIKIVTNCQKSFYAFVFTFRKIIFLLIIFVFSWQFSN